ncbi:MAG: hypothetical protein WAP03_24190 [Methylorubrum rhodinum]|uniref:hypothetical protein n=1 Tax=Methylorubrum rhodinum TaxID=29428 RepID=UPI003BAF0DF1
MPLTLRPPEALKFRDSPAPMPSLFIAYLLIPLCICIVIAAAMAFSSAAGSRPARHGTATSPDETSNDDASREAGPP